MYTKEEVEKVRKWRKEEKKGRGKLVRHTFRGGSSGEYPSSRKQEEKVTKLTRKGNVYTTEENVKYYPCSYCSKFYRPSLHSYESGEFFVCEECSIRRLPLDLRGGYEKEFSGKKSDYKPGVDQKTQLKPTALEVINYKAGTQGFPQKVEAFEEQKVRGKRRRGVGRPRKYHTPEEKREAHKLYLRKRAKEARK